MEFREAYDPFRAMRDSWKLVQAAPLGILVGGLVLTLLDFSFCSYEASIDDADMNEAAGVVLAALVCVACTAGVAFFVLDSLLRVGYATVVERAAVMGEDRIGDLFRSRGRLLSMVMAQILGTILAILALAPFGIVMAGAILLGLSMGSEETAAVLGVLTFLLCVPGYIYVLLGLSLIPEAVAFERLWPVDAVARSWRLVSGNRLWLFWFVLVKWMFVRLGLCFFFCGVFATGIYAYVFSHEAYLRLIRDDQDTWVIDGGPGGRLLSVDRILRYHDGELTRLSLVDGRWQPMHDGR